MSPNHTARSSVRIYLKAAADSLHRVRLANPQYRIDVDSLGLDLARLAASTDRITWTDMEDIHVRAMRLLQSPSYDMWSTDHQASIAFACGQITGVRQRIADSHGIEVFDDDVDAAVLGDVIPMDWPS